MNARATFHVFFTAVGFQSFGTLLTFLFATENNPCIMEQSLATLLLALVTAVLSYKGFNDPSFTVRYRFDVEKVLAGKEYYRLLTSGFLHNGWMHLIFNLIALFAFGTTLEPFVGPLVFLLLYFLSMAGGKLLALWVHKAHSDYTSVGASGAVNGIIYAAIALFPDMRIGLLFLPIAVPAWAFGLLYVLFTLYGIKAKWGNTNHAAHLGGALTGMLLASAFYPALAAHNVLPIALIALPTIAFLLLSVYKPELLLTDSFRRKQAFRTVDQEYNHRRAQEQLDVDGILEKIHRKGMKSLTKREREALERYSRLKR